MPLTAIIASTVGQEAPGEPGAEAVTRTVPPSEVSGVSVPASAPPETEDPVTTLHVQAFVERDDGRHPMPVVSLPIVSDVPGLAVVVEENGGDSVHLLTDLVDVYAALKGGHFTLGRRSIPDARRPADFQIGPPFGQDIDGSLRYDYRVEREDGALTLTLSADSLQHPGLRIDKYVRVRPGAREIEHWVTLTALGRATALRRGARRAKMAVPADAATGPAGSGTVLAGGRLSLGGYGNNINLNPSGAPAMIYTPVADAAQGTQIVACDAQLDLLTDAVVPQTPDRWPETWTAARRRAHGDLFAWFWKPDGVAKVKVSRGILSSLESVSRELSPGETFEVAHVWFGFGLASLTEIRQRWGQLVGGSAAGPLSWHELRGLPAPVRPVEARWLDAAPVEGGTTVARRIALDFALPVEPEGEPSLVVPPGWQAKLVDPPPSVSAGPDGSATLDAEFVVPAGATGTAATVRLVLKGEYELTFDLPLLVAATPGTAPVEIQERVLEGRPVISVDATPPGVATRNTAAIPSQAPSGEASQAPVSRLRFDVMADLGGNLIRLQDGAGRDFLHDTFPENAAYSFVDYYTGGAQPIALTPDSKLSYPAEAVVAKVVEEGPWRGVEVAWVVKQFEELRGQRLALTYLVAPGLDLIRVRSVHENPTARRVHVLRGLAVFIDPAMGGEGSAIVVPGVARPWVRHPATRMFVGPDSLTAPWIWLADGAPVGARSLGLLGTSAGRTMATCFAASEFVGAFLIVDHEAAPGTPEHPSRDVAEFAIVVNHPASEAETLLAALQAVAAG